MKKNIIFILLILVSVAAALAENPFNGLLLGMDGKPIKGARVYVRNPREYAKSDKEGKFGLTYVEPTDTLHIVIRKKIKYEVPVDGRKGMRIIIGDNGATAKEDEEIINMGLGYVKRREYLGSRSGITGEELAKTGETDLVAALCKAMPSISMQETQHTKDNGDGTLSVTGYSYSINIRNSMSVNASTAPLWVVDGSASTTPPPVTVMEVQKVEVLKDGSGWGTRGANGVIIVTLKDGSDQSR